MKLIDFGLEKYADTWFPMYSAYRNKGLILERAGRYDEAYEAFLKAREFIVDKEGHLCDSSAELIWALMHKDNFQYSEEMEMNRNEIADLDNEFFSGFVNVEFRIAVAE